MLLEHGADYRVKTKTGSALIMGIESGNLEIV